MGVPGLFTSGPNLRAERDSTQAMRVAGLLEGLVAIHIQTSRPRDPSEVNSATPWAIPCAAWKAQTQQKSRKASITVTTPVTPGSNPAGLPPLLPCRQAEGRGERRERPQP